MVALSVVKLAVLLTIAKVPVVPERYNKRYFPVGVPPNPESEKSKVRLVIPPAVPVSVLSRYHTRDKRLFAPVGRSVVTLVALAVSI